MAVAPTFNGDALVAELDARRAGLGLGWPALTQWLGLPAADFVHPATW